MVQTKVYLKIGVSGGKFTTYSESTPDNFSDTSFMGNGWRATAYPDQSIRCSYAVKSPDGCGQEQIIFKVTKCGYVTLKRRLPNGTSLQIVKPYKLRKWPVDGIIGLVTGGEDGPYAYFHKQDYETIKEKYGISEVINENPNGLHTLYNISREEEQLIETETISTDGCCTKTGENKGNTTMWQQQCPGTSSYELYEIYHITGATWVLITLTSSKQGKKRTLITMRSNKELKGIPKRDE